MFALGCDSLGSQEPSWGTRTAIPEQLLQLLAKRGGSSEAALKAARRLGQTRWCSDSSTFSALNLEPATPQEPASPLDDAADQCHQVQEGTKANIEYLPHPHAWEQVAADQHAAEYQMDAQGWDQNSILSYKYQDPNMMMSGGTNELHPGTGGSTWGMGMNAGMGYFGQDQCHISSMVPLQANIHAAKIVATLHARATQAMHKMSTLSTSKEYSKEGDHRSRKSLPKQGGKSPSKGKAPAKSADLHRTHSDEDMSSTEPGTSPSAASEEAAREADDDNLSDRSSVGSKTRHRLRRDELLQFRVAAGNSPVPGEIASFVTSAEVPSSPDCSPSAAPTLPLASSSTPKASPSTPKASPSTPKAPSRQVSFAMQGSPSASRSSKAQPELELPASSPSAYRVCRRGTLSHSDGFKRHVQSLLNKICPENVMTIGERLAETSMEDALDLEHMIQLIFKKALAEPHYCETYADLVFRLKSAFPEFPSPDGSKPFTFKAALLNTCQAEFESLPTCLDDTEEECRNCDDEELASRRKRRKDNMLANMKFIGHLFLRQLLSGKAIGGIITQLTLCGDPEVTPAEHVLECACELLLSVGITLESMPYGKQAVMQVCGRLLELKNRKDETGRNVLPKRIQFAIQDLLDIRAAGWAKRSFKAAAKTKEEIRLKQQQDLDAQASGRCAETAEHVVVGMRPQYLVAS